MNNNEENEKISDQNDFSLGQIFNKPSQNILQSLTGKITEIIQKEFNLLKDGFKEDFKASKLTIGLIGAGIVSALVTVVLLFVTLIFALARRIPGWIAGLIVSGITGSIAAFTIIIGWKKRARDPFTSVKEALSGKNIFSSEDKDFHQAA